MSKLEKLKGISPQKADAVADIDLINRFSVKKLKPEDVFCFSLILCDNEVDRDNERFTNDALKALAPLFVGKTGILDHNWSANNQIARLYRVEIEDAGKENSLGEPLKILRGSAYMLRNEENQPFIDAIEGGIKKEISVGCAMSKCTCSICGEPISWCGCKNGHIKGEKYNNKLCFGELEDPTDAYEFSFVAVPAQRGASITKGFEDVNKAFNVLMSADLSGHTDKVDMLIKHLQTDQISAEEREKRAQILKENEKYLKF